MRENGVQQENLCLFETKSTKEKGAYSLFAASVLAGIFCIWLYRLTHVPASGERGRWSWIGMFISELMFGVYWVFTQSPRFNVVHRFPFKERLSLRYENRLPAIDVFVCTANYMIEPPSMVINTVLSAMSYNYPQEKLSVYLSDDGGSEFTFYALLEASEFARYWIPFCKRFMVEPRAPAAYFDQDVDLNDAVFAEEWFRLKKLYEDMVSRIGKTIEQGNISEEVRKKHKGFEEWKSIFPKNNHQAIVQIMIDRRNPNSVDIAGHPLPTLVYMSREKRPEMPHHFKAGALNALLRVSSEISNAPIIHLLDCDMYSNDPDAVRDALCFLMDENQGHNMAFVQHPQMFHNITKNDIYANISNVIYKVELPGLCGYGAALFCGTGGFHRRLSLCGQKYYKDKTNEFFITKDASNERTIQELEEKSRFLAGCGYEVETQWGKEMGMVYGFPVEDIVTGLAIQGRGWKSIYYDPSKSAFLGVAPTTLETGLVQYKRWSEGMFQIFVSKYCPFIHGHGGIKLAAQMAYCIYLLWAPMSLPTIYYLIAPAFCLIHNIPLYPKVSSPWFIPFAYVFIASNVYGLFEAFSCGDTLKSWWNAQRMWMFRRSTSYFFAFLDTMTKLLGFSQIKFVLTTKVVDDDVQRRYKNGMLEFGNSSIMFIIIATLALLNLFGLFGGIFNTFVSSDPSSRVLELYVTQIILCALAVLINLPVYEALFLRSDEGCLPVSVLWKSMAVASLAFVMPF